MVGVKILQVVPIFHPAYGFGGLSETTYQISKALVKIGHEVVVYTSDALDLKRRLRVGPVEQLDGIEVHYFRNIPFRPIEKLFVTPKLVSKAKKMIKDFDIIHLQGHWSFQNIVLHHYAMKNSVPFILQTHGSLPRGYTRQGMKRIFELLFGDRILRDASKVIAVSQMEVEQYMSRFVPNGKIELIPNGVDLSVLKAAKGSFRKKFSIRKNQKVLLFLGRLHPLKGVDLLIKAFAHLIQEYDDLKLVIVGPDEGQLSSLKQIAQSLGLADNILFTGPLYETEKFEAYIDSDVFIVPSRYEIFGIVILEAYAFSKPVVASNLPSITDLVIDGKTGFLFKSGHVQSLADGIGKVLQSSENARIMGFNGRRFVEENFSIEKVAKKIESVYATIVL